MNNLFVNCNNCGEQLQIEDGIMFTTCRSCNSSLEIVRTFNSIYTKVIQEELFEESSEKPVGKPFKVATKTPQRMKLVKDEVYNKLEILDREWENQLPQLTTNGHSSSDNNVAVFIIAIVGFIGLCIWIFKGIASEMHLGFTIFGVVLFIALLFYVLAFIVKQQKYNSAKDDYEQKRTQLLNELNS